MNKITKDKRDKLLIIGVLTGLVVSVLYAMVISAQRGQIADLEDKIFRTRESLDKNARWIRQSATVQANASAVVQDLDAVHSQMSPLDKFKWFYNSVEKFRAGYSNVSLLDISREPEIGEIGVLPKFPYPAATFGVKMHSTYHDFGKFISDFENNFPYMRIQGLRAEIDPAQRLAGASAMSNVDADKRERLLFTFKVVTLIKPISPL